MRSPRTFVLAGLLALTLSPLAVAAGEPVSADLEQLSWMTGDWKTDGPRGSMEERWSEITGGSLVGVFRSVNGGKMAMTELLIIEQEGDEIHLRLQQFGPGFVPRADASHFVAVSIGERDVVFRNQGTPGLYELNYHSEGPGDFRIRGRQAEGANPFELVLAGE